jgi:hypothetical protein
MQPLDLAQEVENLDWMLLLVWWEKQHAWVVRLVPWTTLQTDLLLLTTWCLY